IKSEIFSSVGLRLRQQLVGRAAPAYAATIVPHFFSASPTNSNSTFVPGSSATPKSALILLCVVSLPPYIFTGTPASFSAFCNRCACALVSGCPETYTIRNGGIPLLLATCVTAEKSRCCAGSWPNFSRGPNVAFGKPGTGHRPPTTARTAATP